MPVITMPDGQPVGFPDNMPAEQIRELIASKFPQETGGVEPTFAENLSARMDERNIEAAKNIARTAGGDQTMGELALQSLGKNVVGRGLDVIGEGVSSAASTIWDYTPEFITEPAESALKSFMGTDTANTGVMALKEGATQYSEWAAANPRAAANLESVLNIGAVVIPFGIKGKTSKSAGVAAIPVRSQIVKPLIEVGAVVKGEIIPSKLPKEMKKVYSKLEKDFVDPEEFNQALGEYLSSDKALVEVGGDKIATQAETVGQFPAGREVASEFFEGEIPKAPAKLDNIVQETISRNVDYYNAADRITEAGRAKAAPLYTDAYAANQNISSLVIDRILATPAGQKALREAGKDMQNEMSLMARPDPELAAAYRELSEFGLVDELGRGESVASGMKLQTLDYIKRSMDTSINSAMRQGKTGEFKRLVALKKGLVNELDKIDTTGKYVEARKVSGDYLSNIEALELGNKFFTERSGLIKKRLDDIGDAEKQAYRVGVVNAMQNKLEDVADGGNVAALFKKPSNRKRLLEVLEPDQYKTLLKQATDTDKLFNLRNKVMSGSPTARRLLAAMDFEEIAEEAVETMTGLGGAASKVIAVKKIARRIFTSLDDKQAEAVARLLFEKDPVKKLKIVQQMRSSKAHKGTTSGKAERAKLQAFFVMQKLPKMIDDKWEQLVIQGERAAAPALQQTTADLVRDIDTSNIPQEHIDMLRGQPNLAPHFDAEYGAGASKLILNKEN